MDNSEVKSAAIEIIPVAAKAVRSNDRKVVDTLPFLSHRYQLKQSVINKNMGATDPAAFSMMDLLWAIVLMMSDTIAPRHSVMMGALCQMMFKQLAVNCSVIRSHPLRRPVVAAAVSLFCAR